MAIFQHPRYRTGTMCNRAQEMMKQSIRQDVHDQQRDIIIIEAAMLDNPRDWFHYQWLATRGMIYKEQVEANLVEKYAGYSLPQIRHIQKN